VKGCPCARQDALAAGLFPGLNPIYPLSTRQLNRAIHAAADPMQIGKRVSMHNGKELEDGIN
jgi:hypothetical protein